MSILGCPKCASDRITVLQTREHGEGEAIRRRRKCRDCGYRFSTVETIVAEKPKVRIEQKEIENPLWSRDHDGAKANNRYQHQTINLHESTIEILAHRGVLDRAQKEAADRFRSLWERMGGKGASAIDPGKEVVDGGRGAQDITDEQIDAGRKIRACFDCLQQYQFNLVSAICGEGKHFSDLTDDRWRQKVLSKNLQTALSDLAKMWGLQTRRKAG